MIGALDDDVVELWALPSPKPDDVLAVGPGVAVAGAPVAWLDLGRRLEVAGYVRVPGAGGCLRVDGFVAQLALAADDPDDAAVVEHLRRRHGRVCAGQLLCEAGLVELHQVVCTLRRRPSARLDAARIVDDAVFGRDAECARALSIFCALLGDVAGHVALALGARGGVVIAGDLPPALGDWFARSPFRRRFELRAREPRVLRAIATSVLRGGAAPRLVRRTPAGFDGASF